jgi:hypothetical protein
MKSKGRQSHEAGTHDRTHRLSLSSRSLQTSAAASRSKRLHLNRLSLPEKALNACPEFFDWDGKPLRQPEMREDLYSEAIAVESSALSSSLKASLAAKRRVAQ